MIAHDSPENGVTSAAPPASAPLAHPERSHENLAHPSTSPGWRRGDTLVVLLAIAGLVALVSGLVWAITGTTAQVHYELSPHRTERTLPDWTPGPAPVLPTPIPMVLSTQHDDPRAVVFVPAWSVR